MSAARIRTSLLGPVTVAVDGAPLTVNPRTAAAQALALDWVDGELAVGDDGVVPTTRDAT